MDHLLGDMQRQGTEEYHSRSPEQMRREHDLKCTLEGLGGIFLLFSLFTSFMLFSLLPNKMGIMEGLAIFSRTMLCPHVLCARRLCVIFISLPGAQGSVWLLCVIFETRP